MPKSKKATVCPREAMKTVRKDVRDFIKGKAFTDIDHLGEYPTNMATAKRTIIALQDMLDASMDRHARATAYIRELLEKIDMKDEALEDLYYECQSELTEANAIIDEMREDQDAIMRTLRISMED